MHGIRADIGYALRMFRRASGFYAVIIVIIGLGIASSVAIFSLADGILIRPLPYQDPKHLVMLVSYAPKPPFDSNGSVSYNDYLEFRKTGQSFSDVACTFRGGWSRVTVNAGTEPLTMQGAFVSPNLFSLFGRKPLMGRTFTSDEDATAARVIVISETLWAQLFASSPQAIGQDLVLGRERWQIIGVMPADFRVPFLDTQLWAPVRSHPDWHDPEETDPLNRARWDIIARLRSGITVAAAQSEVNSIQTGLRAGQPQFHQDDVRVVPLREQIAGSMHKPLLLLAGAVAFLLLIACANVANLLLARASQRKREIAIRYAFGARQIRVVRQLVTEALILSSAGGALGVAGTFALLPVLKAILPPTTPLLNTVTLDQRGLVVALLLSGVLGVLLGVVPAWANSFRDANEYLKSAGRNLTEARGARRFKTGLVGIEFAVSMVLLTGAALLIRSLLAVLAVDPGFQADNALTAQIELPRDFPRQRAAQLYAEAAQRIRSLPGVTAVGGISSLFFLNETRTHALRQVEGQPPEANSAWTPLVWAQVTGEYFQAMGIRLIRGRLFDDRDRAGSAAVVIVNETLARRYWPHEDPVGKHVKGFDPRGTNDEWLTVIGVVADTRSAGLERAPMSQIYEVQAQRGDPIGYLVVRSGVTGGLASSVRTTLRSLNPNLIIRSTVTLRQLLEQQQMQRRFETWLISMFSLFALLLSMSGVFAVMHYSVVARRSEIGVRIALGAKPGDIFRLVVGHGMLVALSGVLTGFVIALWLSQLMSSMLYGVSPNDGISAAFAGCVLLAVALAGSHAPARAASRIDPIRTLREE